MRLSHALAQLNKRLRLGTHLESKLEGLPFQGTRDRQDHIGQFGSRVHKEVGMNVEVKRCQGLTSTVDVGVCQEQIGAETHQSAHAIGLLLQNAPI